MKGQGSGSGPIRGEWVLRALVRVLPNEFRDRHGLDLIECHRDAWHQEVKHQGVLRKAAFWVRACATLVGMIVRRWSGRWSERNHKRNHGEVGGMGMEQWIQEIRYAVRRLAKQPAFALVVIMTLGLGLGANTAVFSVLHSVLVAPLPYQESEQLVRIYGNRMDRPEGNEKLHLATPATTELRDQVGSLSGVAILDDYAPEWVDLTGTDQPERVQVLRVNADYFDVLGIAPMAGRVFRRDEETSDSRVAVVREDIWQRFMGGRPDAMGQSLILDGEAITVIGVVSNSLTDPLAGVVGIMFPLNLRGDGADNWSDNHLSAFARLAPDTDIAALQTELDVVASRHGEISTAAEGKGFTALPLREDIVGSAQPLLTAIMGAVLFLLLLTTVNVASLLLARAASRERELAIRRCLGSSQGALIRQFMIETGILALAGGVAGVVIGMGSLDLLMAFAPAQLPRSEGVVLGSEAVLFAGGGAVVIGLVLGLATAIPFARPRVEQVASGSRSDGTTSGRPRLRAALVVAEVALAVVLLVGAGVFFRTVQQLQTRDLGADPAGVLAFSVGLPTARYDTREARYRFNEEFHTLTAAIPGVLSVAATSHLPVTGSYNTWGTKRAHAVDEPFEGGQHFDESALGRRKSIRDRGPGTQGRKGLR